MKANVVFSLGCLLLLTAAAFAQDANGRISGTITDNSGGVVPKAQITVTNQNSKLTWKSTSDEKGFYIVTNLPVGIYNVEAAAPGFKESIQNGYDLPDSGHVTADFKMEVGLVSQSVTVTEVVGETVNTVSGELATTIDSEQVQDLALNGRNYLELATLMPGVAMTSLDQMTTTTSLSTTNQSFNGMRTDTNHLAVDGGSNLDSGSNGSQINNVGVDFVQQVRIQTSAFSAEFGRNSGANINVVTKSGGNAFHGSVFETIRNDALDAKDFFAPVKPVLRFNDYGWSFNGPLAFGRFKKGKFFFMVGEEWKEIHHYTSATRQTIPTLAETQGNFSDRTTTTIYLPGTKTPLPNKILPASLITPDGQAIMNVYAKMSTMASLYTNLPTSNNATYQAYNPFNWREDIARIDYRISDNQTLYFRYLHDNYNTIDPFGTFNGSSLPNTPTQRHRPGYGPQLGYTYIIGPHLINESRLSMSWNSQRTYMEGDLWKRSTYGFQFPRIFGGNGEYPQGMPDFSVSGFATVYSADHVYLMSPTTDISVSDNLTYTHNEHTFKGGLLIVRNRKDQNATSYYDGQATFNPSGVPNTTNYSLTDVMTGNFQTYTEAANDPVGFFRFSQYEAFVQDSWRIAKNFSIEVGLRYSHYIPTYTVANNMSNFVPSLYNPATAVSLTASGLIVPGSGNPYDGLETVGSGIPASQDGRVANYNNLLGIPAGGPQGLYQTQNLFMPRFSFAWSPFNDTKTSIRGGFGTFHDRPEGNLVFSQTKLPPFTPQVVYDYGNLANPGGGSAPAAAVQGTITAIDPRLKVPVVETFNFGIQRQLPWGMLLETTWAGNVGHHLIREPNINEPSFASLLAYEALPSSQRLSTNPLNPYLGYSTISYYMSDSNSNYNALQVRASRRRGAVLYTVNYTWSHALADTPGNFNSTTDVIEWANRHFNYGPTNYDRRQLFVATATYRLPFMAKSHGVLHGAFGGWEMSFVGRVQTGQYLTPQGSNSIPGTRRASYNGFPVALSSPTVNKWFNTAAFTNPPTTALGNAGVGVIEGPGWQNYDLSLRKVFTVHEGWQLRIQADTFNILNHPNFGNPDTTITDSGYGSITSSQPARNIQFGARLAF
jgi:hypothetical protein